MDLGLGMEGWTFRLVLGLDGAVLPGAWSELLTAFINVKHLNVECTSGELSLGTDPGSSCPWLPKP